MIKLFNLNRRIAHNKMKRLCLLSDGGKLYSRIFEIPAGTGFRKALTIVVAYSVYSLKTCALIDIQPERTVF
jgi:hypothetical protein